MAAPGPVDGGIVTRRSGLGRGLDALLPAAGRGEPEGRRVYREVSIEEVRPNPSQPREHFDEDALSELVTSIKNLGILQPLLVTENADGAYELVAGERRLRAARAAGLVAVPVVTVESDETSSLERALVENLHREDLNPIEEAAAYKQLIEEGGLTQEELGDRLGRNRSTIANTLRLLDLPESIQGLLVHGRLTAGHGRALLGLEKSPMQERVARRVVAERLSVRQCEELVRKHQAMSGWVSSPGRPRPERPPAAAEAQRRLADHLGTRVRVDIGKRRGKIVVEFAGEDQLARITTAILGDEPGA